MQQFLPMNTLSHRSELLTALAVASFAVIHVFSCASSEVLQGAPADEEVIEKAASLEILANGGNATDDEEFGDVANLGYVGIGMLSWEDASIKQTYTASNFSAIQVVDQVYDSQSGQSDTVIHELSVPFTLRDVDSATLDVFCVAGFNADGDFVLERWTLAPLVQGSRSGFFSLPPQEGPFGEIISKDFTRTEIYSGPLDPDYYAMAFDPDERFVLVLLGDGTTRSLYRFNNEASTSPTLMHSSTQIPELGVIGQIWCGTHAVVGRAWNFMAEDLADKTRLMLIDSDNDGVFDGPPLVGDLDSFYAAGIGPVFGDWDHHDGP